MEQEIAPQSGKALGTEQGLEQGQNQTEQSAPTWTVEEILQPGATAQGKEQEHEQDQVSAILDCPETPERRTPVNFERLCRNALQPLQKLLPFRTGIKEGRAVISD